MIFIPEIASKCPAGHDNVMESRETRIIIVCVELEPSRHATWLLLCRRGGVDLHLMWKNNANYLYSAD